MKQRYPFQQMVLEQLDIPQLKKKKKMDLDTNFKPLAKLTQNESQT